MQFTWIVMPDSAVLSNSLDCGAVSYHTVQRPVMLDSAVLSNSLDCGAVACSSKACYVGQCCTKQFSGLW